MKAYRAYQITIGSIRASYDSRFGINDYIDDGYPAPETYATVKTIEAAQAIAQAFAGLLSLFRTDRQITNFSFDSIPESALISQLNRALQGQSTEITVYYPGNYSFDFSSELGFALNEIFVEIDDLQDLLSRGKEKLGNSAENGLTNSEANDLRALNQLTEDFIQTFSDNNETTEQNALIHLASIRPLACLLQGNGLRCDSFSQGAYVLKVDITSGASRQISDNLFTGSRISHSAGVIVNYMLFDDINSLALGNTLYHETGYTRGSRSNVER